MYEFRWNVWNIQHIGEHGVDPQAAEFVVNHARALTAREKRQFGRRHT